MTWPYMPKPGEAPTSRETQIVKMLAQGLTNREIGRQLRLSEYAIKQHLARISAKLAVSGRGAIVAGAYERGWLRLPDRVVLAQANELMARRTAAARTGRAA